jgi:pyruvate formate lyase activating enzyme
VTVEELFQEIGKDRPFYRRSNGGVTVGGGEATMQHEFVTAFLKKCKQHYIHTAIETSGYVKWEHFQTLLGHLDLVYMDIKHMDPVEHKKLTRVPNELILENVRRASAMRPTIIRTPVVPGLNDSDENILATARFVARLGENVKRYELLPYHQFGVPKYGQLELEYTLAHVVPPSDDHMNHLKGLVESCGVTAQIGG